MFLYVQNNNCVDELKIYAIEDPVDCQLIRHIELFVTLFLEIDSIPWQGNVKYYKIG